MRAGLGGGGGGGGVEVRAVVTSVLFVSGLLPPELNEPNSSDYWGGKMNLKNSTSSVICQMLMDIIQFN